MSTDWVAAMNRNSERVARDIDTRVEALCSTDTSVAAVAFEMADRLYESVSATLANYDKVLDHNGTAHDVLDVIQALRDCIQCEYKALTGREFVVSVNRGRKEEPRP